MKCKVDERPINVIEFQNSNIKEIERLENSRLYKMIDNRPKMGTEQNKFELMTNTSIFAESKEHPKVSFDSRKTYEKVYQLSRTPYTKKRPVNHHLEPINKSSGKV